MLSRLRPVLTMVLVLAAIVSWPAADAAASLAANPGDALLRFPDPEGGEEREVEAPLPADFEPGQS